MEILLPILKVIYIIIPILCLLLVGYRFCKGPLVLDRVLAADSLTMVILSGVAIWQLLVETVYFFDVILVLSVVGFLSTVLLARYLEKGEIVG